jgi:hypothetical protein
MRAHWFVLETIARARMQRVTSEFIGHPLIVLSAACHSFGFGTSERHRPELQPKKTMYVGKDFERQNLGELARIIFLGCSRFSAGTLFALCAVCTQFSSMSFHCGGMRDATYDSPMLPSHHALRA